MCDDDVSASQVCMLRLQPKLLEFRSGILTCCPGRHPDVDDVYTVCLHPQFQVRPASQPFAQRIPSPSDHPHQLHFIARHDRVDQILFQSDPETLGHRALRLFL